MIATTVTPRPVAHPTYGCCPPLGAVRGPQSDPAQFDIDTAEAVISVEAGKNEAEGPGPVWLIRWRGSHIAQGEDVQPAQQVNDSDACDDERAADEDW